MEELKPCPFCDKNFVELIQHEEFKWCYITCCEELGGCGAVTKICFSADEAIELWNMRNEGLMRGNGNKD